MATTLTAMQIYHPWPRKHDSDPYGMAEIIATLGRINISSHVHSTPDWSIVDTSEAVSELVDIICQDVGNRENLSDVWSQPPALYTDIQTIDDESSQRHVISLLQIYLLPREHIYLVDVQTLGRQMAFETTGLAHSHSLKTILESATIPKVLFDVRLDAEILYHRYGVSLAGVQDLQLMELAARAVCPSGSTALPSAFLGSDLMTSAAGGMGIPGRSTRMSAIRRSSRSRAGSVTPPIQYRYPLSPPATPTSNTISLACSPVSTTSTASNASSATTVSTATTNNTITEKDKGSLKAQPKNETADTLQAPRPTRRSLRHLNNLPRCVNRDLNLSILEQITWDKWITLQKKRCQVEMANRELRRLNGLLFSSSLSDAQAVEIAGLDGSKEAEMDVDGQHPGEVYQLLKMDRGMDISARPLRKGSETMELIGLVVMNVRYLPGLWAEYERRLHVRTGSHWLDDRNEAGGSSNLSRQEDLWRKRVELETKERLECAKRGQYALLNGAAGKGRGKLMMLAPVGWD